MFSKGNFFNEQRPKMILLTICLCLVSLVMCEVIDPLIANYDNWYISFPGGLLQQTHLDEHDDDFILITRTASHIIASSILEDKSSHILGSSHSPPPLLPPPKAS